MTNAIKSSITKLDHKISRLEMAVQEAETRAKKLAEQKQKPAGNDLFSNVSNNDAETRALASRLDGAIAKVEALLREGTTRHG